MTKTLDDLISQVELSHEPGTPEYETELRAAKVHKCQELQNVSSCRDCKHFDYCELRIAYWRDVHLKENT